MDFVYMLSILPKLVMKLPLSILVFASAGILSMVWGSFLAFVRIQKYPVLAMIAYVLVSFSRSVPGIIHIFIVYYGLPLILGTLGYDINHLPKIVFAIFALSFYQGACVSEILRPAYLAVPQSQHEAALSIGLTKWQVNHRIIIPQIWSISLPSLGNAATDLLKYTSVLFLIGLADIMGQAEILVTHSYGLYQLEVYVLIALIYWFLSIAIGKAIQCLERKASRYLLGWSRT